LIYRLDLFKHLFLAGKKMPNAHRFIASCRAVSFAAEKKFIQLPNLIFEHYTPKVAYMQPFYAADC